MNEIQEIIEKINNSFLLDKKEKGEFINYLQNANINFDKQKINKLLDENSFINNFLKTLLLESTKDMTYIEIHNTMKIKYLQQIRELEEKEQENLDNIFANFV